METDPTRRTGREPLPGVVCGTDERMVVDPATSPPYGWICRLEIVEAGGVSQGSGWLLNTPNSRNRIIVTARHCLETNNVPAAEIRVFFPGLPRFDVGPADLRLGTVHPSNPTEFDYGAIVVPQGAAVPPGGFGIAAAMSLPGTIQRVISVAGYPVSDPRDRLLTAGNMVRTAGDEVITYMVDTSGGQSGGPVWTYWNGFLAAIGVHTGAQAGGVCPNRAFRLGYDAIHDLMVWCGAGAPQAWLGASIQSVEYPGVYLYMNGNGVTHYNPDGAGTVRCQFGVGPTERFDIFPLCYPAAGQDVDTASVPYAVRSTVSPDVFLRLDPDKVSKWKPDGSGTVNCQYGAGTYELFTLRAVQGGTAIESWRNASVYLRMYGKDVHAHDPNGSGVVNCQFGQGVSEVFQIA